MGKSLKARVKIQERLEARRIKAPFVAIKQPDIHFDLEPITEETTAIKVSDYSVSFDELLLEKVNFEIKSTDKVAIIGANGTGKTTLLREIFKNKNASIEISEGTNIAYLSQLQGETLNEDHTIMDEFLEAGFKTYEEVITYLLGYGFEKDILNQKIGSLSGGEKNILQLAKISTSGANMLLLDEPTSHLDTYSQIALEKAIENYNGGILMVSHDFYSIVNCMDFVLIIENQTVRKTNMKKFKKLIYAKHFDRDYLELEEKKKAVEVKIELALKENDFEQAKVLSEQLEILITLFKIT